MLFILNNMELSAARLKILAFLKLQASLSPILPR